MKDGNKFAFPHEGRNNPGMTLRQFYKGMALAQLANSDVHATSFDPVDVATYCGEVADALLREDEEAGR